MPATLGHVRLLHAGGDAPTSGPVGRHHVVHEAGGGEGRARRADHHRQLLQEQRLGHGHGVRAARAAGPAERVRGARRARGADNGDVRAPGDVHSSDVGAAREGARRPGPGGRAQRRPRGLGRAGGAAAGRLRGLAGGVGLLAVELAVLGGRGRVGPNVNPRLLSAAHGAAQAHGGGEGAAPLAGHQVGLRYGEEGVLHADLAARLVRVEHRHGGVQGRHYNSGRRSVSGGELRCGLEQARYDLRITERAVGQYLSLSAQDRSSS
mmetsp:Transcript_79006/g.207408  ORF Transcript_79006/g.207408 Transcript_79006/m.207408 type:complete len:265 (-) Transcript_79006:35-829(-)